MKGLDDRSRDQDGEIRHKRGDTLVGNLRNTYGAGFAPGYRPEDRLDTILRNEGCETLDQYLKKGR
jgi:hypothetical protein